MFSSVCETIVPITVGSFSRGRPVRRATIERARGLAQAGRQRRGHEHADERALQRVASPAARPRAAPRAGSRARPRARTAIERHIRPSETTTQTGLEASEAAAMRSRPMRCSARQRARAPASAGDGDARRGAPRCAAGRAPPRTARARGWASAAAATRAARRRARARRARPAARPRRRAPARRHGDRLLVGARHLARRRCGQAKRSRALGGPGRQPVERARRSSARSRSVSASAVASPRGTSTPSTPSRDDVAVAGDVARRRPACPRRRPPSGPCRSSRRRATGAQSTSAVAHAAAFSRVADAPEHRHAARVEEQRLDLLGARADHRELRGDVRRAAPRRRAAGSAGPCARRPGRRRRCAAGRRRPAARAAHGALAAGATPLGTTR